MPETEIDFVSKEWLQSELRAGTKNLIVLDCRSTNEFQEGHIRSAVNFSIPSIMLRRLAAGKIDLTSTIKCRDLKQRIQIAYSDSLFILYNDNMDLNTNSEATTINVLRRRLKQDGCRVVWLEGKIFLYYIFIIFSSLRCAVQFSFIIFYLFFLLVHFYHI